MATNTCTAIRTPGSDDTVNFVINESKAVQIDRYEWPTLKYALIAAGFDVYDHTDRSQENIAKMDELFR